MHDIEREQRLAVQALEADILHRRERAVAEREARLAAGRTEHEAAYAARAVRAAARPASSPRTTQARPPRWARGPLAALARHRVHAAGAQ